MPDDNSPDTQDEKQPSATGKKASTVGERRRKRLRKKTGARTTFILVGVLIVFALGYFECIRSTPGESNDVTKGLILGPLPGGRYEDDITKGKSKQWWVKAWVQVTMLHGEIIDIKVLSHRHFWPKAKKATQEIPKRILASQSTKVKAISGATLSSKAIMLAVQNALDENQKKNRWDPHEKTGEGGRWDDKY